MKVLFFSPFGGFNGAEMQLNYMLSGVDKGKISGEVFVLGKGKLFDKCGFSVNNADLPRLSFTQRVVGKILKQDNSDTHRLERRITDVHNRLKPDFWYINTLNIQDVVLETAKKLGVKFVIHVHELSYYYSAKSWEMLEWAVKNAAALIGCSEKVTENLKVLGGKHVIKFYELIDFDAIKIRKDKINILRKQLSIPEESFIWGMSGGSYFRKGTDYIPQIFAQLPQSHLIWIGQFARNGYNYYVNQMIESMNLHNIHFVGEQREDYYNYMALCDGFLLTSREDPFPLVMIEAAALGKPIVAFDSGGVSEFVLDEMGIVVNTWKPEDIVEAMKKVESGQIALSQETSRKRASMFSVAGNIHKWEEILVSLKE